MNLNFSDPSSVRAVYKRLAKNSYSDFCKFALNEVMPKHSCTWVDWVESNKYSCVLGPREHVKTWTFERYMLWKIAQNPDIRIILVSDTAALAETILRYPRSQIEENPRFRAIYGDLVDDRRWSSNEFIIKRPNSKDRNATLYAIGMWGAVVGRRADLIILDDPIDWRKVSTAGMRAKVIEWIFTELTGTLAPEGKVIFIGSRKGRQDLYSYIQDEKPWVKMLVSRAVEEWPGDIREDGSVIEEPKVLWPEHWPYESLMERKELSGNTSFYLNFQNECKNLEDTLINEDDIDYAKDPELLLEEEAEENCQYAMGVDFAVEDDPLVAKKKDTDYFAITVLKRVGINPEDNVAKLVYCFEDRGLTPDQQEAKVIEVGEMFKPMLLYCEANAFQRIYTAQLQKKTSLPVKPFVTSKDKWSPTTGVPCLRTRFELKKYKIPTGNKTKTLLTLIQQLKDFSPNMGEKDHDDLFMSFYFATRALIDAPKFYKKVFIGDM